jgi:antibiotic biosynthesis monooxygenase (ABM) superfamily enzyme
VLCEHSVRASRKDLHDWLYSQERASLLAELGPLLHAPTQVSANSSRSLPDGFTDLLVSSNDAAPLRPPPKWKVVLLTTCSLFLIVYPTGQLAPPVFRSWGVTSPCVARLLRLAAQLQTWPHLQCRSVPTTLSVCAARRYGQIPLSSVINVGGNGAPQSEASIGSSHSPPPLLPRLSTLGRSGRLAFGSIHGVAPAADPHRAELARTASPRRLREGPTLQGTRAGLPLACDQDADCRCVLWLHHHRRCSQGQLGAHA